MDVLSQAVNAGLQVEREDPRILLRRVEAALQALSDGRARIAAGAEAVEQLRCQLDRVRTPLGLDLREVQESVVEHAAMYARNPEVLGGMLHLVFCFDLVREWLSERDGNAQALERRLRDVEGQLGVCREYLLEVEGEARACSERAAALALAADLGRISQGSRQRAAANAHCEVAVQADEHCLEPVAIDGADNAVRTAREAKALLLLKDSKREISQLQTKLACQEELLAENAHLQAKLASNEVAGLRRAPLATTAASPAQGLVTALEQLEPMLASLPLWPEMVELQEEACDAYGRLRSILLEAASMPQSIAAILPGSGCGSQAWTVSEASRAIREPAVFESQCPASAHTTAARAWPSSRSGFGPGSAAGSSAVPRPPWAPWASTPRSMVSEQMLNRLA